MIMDNNIDKLISLTYELEGLLLLLRDRGQESVAPYIRNLIADKGRTLAKQLDEAGFEPQHETPAKPEPAPLPPIPQTQPQPTAPAPTAVEEKAAMPPVAEVCPPTPAAPAPVSAPAAVEKAAEIIEKKAEVTVKADETAPTPAPAPTEPATLLNEAQAEEDEADTEAAEAEAAEKKMSPEIRSSEEAGAKMLKLLTLNDRFMFRRELFGGSDTAMKAIMSVIAVMPTLDDAKRYLTEEQGLDAESEEGSYFLEIIAPYYNKTV